jgi:tripartite-type tricarboxylate transporter receptor subunit TctC
MARFYWKTGGVVSAVLMALAVPPAMAQQDYPTKEIKVVVGFGAGGGGDILARYFSDKLSQKAGKPVIVENKVGALGNIASEFVARAKPDGYTLQITGANGTHASAKYMFKNLPFDPQKDFTPITTVARLAFVLMIDPKTPATNVAELTAHLKKKGRVSFGSANTTSLVAGELYSIAAGLNGVNVPYRATTDAFNELLGGQIDYMFMDATFSIEQARAGRLRALAVSSGERLSMVPEIPSMKEAGLGDFDLAPWWAFFGPAGLPQPIVAKLEGWLNEIVKTPETKEFLNRQGTEPFPGNSKMMGEYLAKEIGKWEAALKAAKVQPQ